MGLQGFREQRDMDRSTAPEVAAGLAVYLTPGITYCLLPHAWLQVRAESATLQEHIWERV